MCNISREVKCLPISVPAILRGNQMHTPQSYSYKLSSLSSLAECQICLQLHFDNVEYLRGKRIENHYICFHVMSIQHDNFCIYLLYILKHTQNLYRTIHPCYIENVADKNVYKVFEMPFYLQSIFFCNFLDQPLVVYFRFSVHF